MNVRKAGLFVCFAAACGAQEPGAARRLSVNIGSLALTPGGFLDLIGESRSDHRQLGILGGQVWSLLRPNRKRTSSDTDLMHTDVIDPAYHVGLLGSRVRQLRMARTLGDYKAVFAWESPGNFAAKATVDKKRWQAELAALIGHGERKGLMAAGVVNLSQRLQLVTQEYRSKRAASEALGVVPAEVNGAATIQGLEFHPVKAFEIYSYG
jgi:hypothetical protein